MRPMRKEWKLFLTFFIVYAVLADYVNWNENSRLDLTMAMVEDHSLAIDSSYNNTGDMIYYKGHYYSDKAPGMSVLAVPVYGIYRVIFGKPELHRNLYNLDVPAGYLLLMFLAIVLTSSVFGSLSVVLVYKISAYFTRQETIRNWLVVAYGFGTIALVYSRLFFGHMTAAFFSFLSFYLIFRERMEKKGYPLLAGLAAGFAVFVEYTSAIIVLCMLGLLIFYRNWKSMTKFTLGLAIVICLLFVYQFAIFGTPFTTAYNTIDKDDATEKKIYEEQLVAAAAYYGQAGDSDLHNLYMARGTEDTGFCRKIVISETKNLCVRAVVAATENVSACEFLSTADQVLYCKATAIKNKLLCNNISASALRIQCVQQTTNKRSFLILRDYYFWFKNSWRTSLYTIFLVLFFPYKGMFFYSPILLFSMIGLFYMHKKFSKELFFIVAVLVLTLLFYSTIKIWWGGSSFGPRHLMVVMPFLMIPLVFSMSRFRGRIVVPFILLSVLLTTVGLQIIYEPINFRVASFTDNIKYFSLNLVNLLRNGPQSLLLERLLNFDIFPYSNMLFLLAIIIIVWRSEIFSHFNVRRGKMIVILMIVVSIATNVPAAARSLNLYPMFHELTLNGYGWYGYEPCWHFSSPKIECSWMKNTASIVIHNTGPAKTIIIQQNVKSLLDTKRKLTVAVNGKPTSEINVQRIGQYEFSVPLSHGKNIIVLSSDNCEVPRQMIGVNDDRCLSFALQKPRAR
jgi:hypothetical protein